MGGDVVITTDPVVTGSASYVMVATCLIPGKEGAGIGGN